MNRRAVRFLRYAVLDITEYTRKPPRRSSVLHTGPERDWKYRAWVRKFPCSACSSLRFVECAHTGIDGGVGQKSSDFSCIPLCALCHRVGPRSFHAIGRNEFERLNRLDFAIIIRNLLKAWRTETQ